jgi:leucyl-tRNA synthetase
MALINDIYKKGSVTRGELKTFITLLNPAAPHLTEEMWERAGFAGCLNETTWPVADESKCVDDEVEIVVQINGKVKDKLMVPADLSREEMETYAKENEQIKELIEGKEIVKIICVPKNLVNIVVK